MTGPLRRAPDRATEDLGDVLASIRRLIAQEQAAAPEVAPLAAQQSAGQADIPSARPVIDSATLSQAVDAAAQRMAETARRVEVARGDAPDAPFRLNPEALIPPLSTRPFSDARLRLTPALAAVPEMPPPEPQADADPAAVSDTHEDDAAVGARVATTAASHGPDRMHVAADETTDEAPLAGAVSEPPAPSSLKETTPVQTTLDRPLDRPHATITPHPAAGVAPMHAAVQPTAHPAAAAPVAAAPAAEGQLVRQLLRDAIRAELAAELGERMDHDLRQMVRQEIASALSAALSDALRVPALR